MDCGQTFFNKASAICDSLIYQRILVSVTNKIELFSIVALNIWIVVYMWLQNHIWGGGARWWSYRKWRHRPWPEMTSPELEVTFPRFFLTIVVVQNVSLRITDRATGSNVTGFPRVRTCETRSWGFLPISFFIRNDVTRRVEKKVREKSTGKRLSNREKSYFRLRTQGNLTFGQLR